jgi:RNA polymerase sigma-70 factor (ECF subfamily)
MDEQAFQALYRQTAGPLRAYVARTMGSVTHADDIVQETFLRALRRPAPTEDPKERRAYLFRIASNLMIDHWRRNRHETDPGDRHERAAAVRDAALRLDMATVFRQLRPRERQLLWLAHVEEADHREIASALGLKSESIRVLLSRARGKLADLLRRSGHVPAEKS